MSFSDILGQGQSYLGQGSTLLGQAVDLADLVRGKPGPDTVASSPSVSLPTPSSATLDMGGSKVWLYIGAAVLVVVGLVFFLRK